MTDKLVLFPVLVSPHSSSEWANVKRPAIKMAHKILSGFAEKHNVGCEAIDWRSSRNNL